MSAMLLEVERLSKSFGGVQAVQDVSFGVAQGEMVAVIGPNGAGKTTLFNAISGIFPPTGGFVRFQGVVTNGKKPHELAMLGMTRTFQNLQLFSDMTVAENVMVGFHPRLTGGIFSAGFRLPRAAKEEQTAREEALSRLAQVGLAHLAAEKAGTLPYGMQRLVEIARAAVSRPSLILLDEPMAGLNPQESRRLVDVLLVMREQGFTFLFVEHDMETVMAIADRIVVLDYGKKIAEGAPKEIVRHPDVIKAYLGEETV